METLVWASGLLAMMAYQCTWWGVTPGNRGRWTGLSSQLQALLLIWAMSEALFLTCEMWPEGSAHDVAWCIMECLHSWHNGPNLLAQHALSWGWGGRGGEVSGDE